MYLVGFLPVFMSIYPSIHPSVSQSVSRMLSLLLSCSFFFLSFFLFFGVAFAIGPRAERVVVIAAVGHQNAQCLIQPIVYLGLGPGGDGWIRQGGLREGADRLSEAKRSEAGWVDGDGSNTEQCRERERVRCIALHCIASHRIASRRIASHRIASKCTALHWPGLASGSYSMYIPKPSCLGCALSSHSGLFSRNCARDRKNPRIDNLCPRIIALTRLPLRSLSRPFA